MQARKTAWSPTTENVNPNIAQYNESVTGPTVIGPKVTGNVSVNPRASNARPGFIKKKSALSFSVEMPEKDLEMHTDRMKVKQILLNLLCSISLEKNKKTSG